MDLHEAFEARRLRHRRSATTSPRRARALAGGAFDARRARRAPARRRRDRPARRAARARPATARRRWSCCCPPRPRCATASAGCAPAPTSTSASPTTPAYVVARARDLVRRRRRRSGAAASARPVLVIDDSLTFREELRGDLEAAGLRGRSPPPRARRGCAIAADRRPSAVIVDGVMPGIDGATFIRQLRADAALRTTPCILLTGVGRRRRAARARRRRRRLRAQGGGARRRPRAAPGAAPRAGPSAAAGPPGILVAEAHPRALGAERDAARASSSGCGTTGTRWW